MLRAHETPYFIHQVLTWMAEGTTAARLSELGILTHSERTQLESGASLYDPNVAIEGTIVNRHELEPATAGIPLRRKS